MSDLPQELPERVSVSMMARRLGMSRTRLYQLLGTTFPSPNHDEDGRPYFDRDQQKQILEAYRNNRGLDGKTVFFRPKRGLPIQPKPKRKQTAPLKSGHADLLQTIRSMGLPNVKPDNLQRVIQELYPQGIREATPEVVRTVFVHLHRQLSSDNPRR
jgi:hypothetical protein